MLVHNLHNVCFFAGCSQVRNSLYRGPMLNDQSVELRDLRGGYFPARHGTRKCLEVPKRGKAALWAEIQGRQGAVQLVISVMLDFIGTAWVHNICAESMYWMVESCSGWQKLLTLLGQTQPNCKPEKVDLYNSGPCALWYRFEGQGKEVLRGRSSFKRSPKSRGYRCFSPAASKQTSYGKGSIELWILSPDSGLFHVSKKAKLQVSSSWGMVWQVGWDVETAVSAESFAKAHSSRCPGSRAGALRHQKPRGEIWA